MSLTGIAEVADLANGIINKIWPDKTQAEKDAAAYQMQQVIIESDLVKGQLAIDQAEATSSDPLQHWRGGLGWVCTLGYAWNFVLLPLVSSACIIFWHPLTLPTLDLGQLSTLTAGMLGLGTLHVAERIKGAA